MGCASATVALAADGSGSGCDAACGSLSGEFGGSAQIVLDRPADAYGVQGTQETQTVSFTWTATYSSAAQHAGSAPWKLSALSGSYQDTGTNPDGSTFSCTATLGPSGSTNGFINRAAKHQLTVAAEVPFGNTAATVQNVTGDDPYCGSGGGASALGGSAPEWAQWLPSSADLAGGGVFPEATLSQDGGTTHPPQYSYTCSVAECGINVSATVSSTVTVGGCTMTPVAEPNSLTAATIARASRSSCGTYVALGDSFSSGQIGGRAPCYRSSSAYPSLYARRSHRNLIFVACSGATSVQIAQGQLGQVNRRTTLVSLTAGGDDADLFGDLKTCVFEGWDPKRCKAKIDLSSRSSGTRLSDVARHLRSLFAAIHHRAPHARVFILGYPSPVPNLIPRACILPLRAWEAGGLIGLRQEDAELFAPVLASLNDTIRTTASHSGVHYVAPFRGHTICSQAPWFFPLQRGAATLHPNAAGQSEMADLLSAAVAHTHG
jgi:lysophospholipase L1-like esterase